MNGIESLAGRLQVQPGTARPLSGGRPIATPALLQRLVAGLPAAQLPQRLGSLFTLCGTAHRLTAGHALRAAQGLPMSAQDAACEAMLLRLWTVREHLQRLALDLPLRVPAAGIGADARWLRGLPLWALPDSAEQADPATLRQTHQALRPWLETHLVGMPADDWLALWRAEAESPAGAASPLAQWCAGKPLPVPRWLNAVRGAAQALALPAWPLEVLNSGEAGLRALAAAMCADDVFTSRPAWLGAPAETGCWTRASLQQSMRRPQNAWMRWLHRIAETLQLAGPGPGLRLGALGLGPSQALGFSEMSRGLLLYWLQLDGNGRVEGCRVLAPTEWNFHPGGMLAGALAAGGLRADAVRAAVAAMDPCVEVDLRIAEPADA